MPLNAFQLADAVRNHFQLIATFDYDTLPKLQDDEDIAERGRELANIGEVAVQLPLEQIPLPFLRVVHSRLAVIANSLTQFKVRHQRGPNPAGSPLDSVESLRHQLGSQFIDTFRDLMASLTLLGLRHADLASVRSQAERSLERLDSTIRNAEEHRAQVARRCEACQNELASLLESLRSTAAEFSAGVHSSSFEGIAASHDKTASRWLRATLAGALAALAAACVFLWYAPPLGELNQASAIQELVSRVTVIGLCVLGTAWCAKVYRVHAHLSAVNRHRSTALGTFGTFHAGAHTPQLRDEVLRAAAATVFQPTITGFVDAKEEKANNEIMELLRALPLPVR